MNLRSLILSCSCIIFSLPGISQNQISGDTVTITRDGDTAIFAKVEVEASFPGGDKEWRKYLQRNLRGDVGVENGAPAGQYTVVIQFIVDKNGDITDVTALSKNGYGMEQEVIRLIKNGPKWQPAMLNGAPVKAYRKQPITFVIEQDNFQITTEEPYILYTGIDNNVTIVANKVKPDDLDVTISQGTILPKGNGNYTLRVARAGRIIITLYNKKHKEIGAASFEVRQKDKPAISPTPKG